MIIKKYTVQNMNEALTRIRYELGKDAIIISQRKVRQKGIKGYFSKKLVEVTAALENEKLDSKRKNTKVEQEDYNFNESLNSIKKLIKDNENSNNSDLGNVTNKNEEEKYIRKEEVASKDNSELENEVKEIKSLLNRVIKNTAKEEEKDLVAEYLNALDIKEDYFNDIKGRGAKDINSFKEDFKEIIKNDIELWTGDLSGNIVLVGPTGVGKTTTIAKLAGRLALIEKKKVGLITIDTYRIGAVEQLKTYAEIMDIPFKVVITLKEMEEAVKSLNDCDVVLIDTTGRSSKNTMQLSELRAFVQKVKADHIALVISGTTKNRDIDIILKGYEEIGYEKVIITKLDETSTYGAIYNISKKSNKPIAYITTGQNVPGDIKKPTINEIQDLITGEETIC